MFASFDGRLQFAYRKRDHNLFVITPAAASGRLWTARLARAPDPAAGAKSALSRGGGAQRT